MTIEITGLVKEHADKSIIAATETGLFGIAGLLYPPLFLGMIVTAAETYRQQFLAIREINKKSQMLQDSAHH